MSLLFFWDKSLKKSGYCETVIAGVQEEKKIHESIEK